MNAIIGIVDRIFAINQGGICTLIRQTITNHALKILNKMLQAFFIELNDYSLLEQNGRYQILTMVTKLH